MSPKMTVEKKLKVLLDKITKQLDKQNVINKEVLEVLKDYKKRILAIEKKMKKNR